MQLEFTTFELAPVLHQAAAMLRERATMKGIDVDVSVDENVGEVEADELRLKQVVLNLLTNAVKFTGEGGSVVVRATRSGPDTVSITVTDTGIGVPPEDRERIFESFQQGGRGASREEGTGLGLTLSRRIVELAGGSLWVESDMGVGSTFGFSLPTGRRVADPPGAAGASTELPDVVMIDDDRPSLDLLMAYLSGTPLRITTARDGASGLEAVRRVRPAAVLLDIRLPRLDGWNVLEALKADPETRDIPVVVVSIIDDRPRGLALGAAEYLVKPVSKDDLLIALGSVGALRVAGNGRSVEVTQ
jgi:CheY-like chemotaxis protein